MNTNANLIEEISKIASLAETKGCGVFIWCTRMSWYGRVERIRDECIVLKDASVILGVGGLDSETYARQEKLPNGLAVIRISTIESVFIGKKFNKETEDKKYKRYGLYYNGDVGYEHSQFD